MKLIRICYSLPGLRDDSFKVVGSKVKVTDNIFEKCTFQRRHTDRVVFVYF